MGVEQAFINIWKIIKLLFVLACFKLDLPFLHTNVIVMGVNFPRPKKEQYCGRPLRGDGFLIL